MRNLFVGRFIKVLFGIQQKVILVFYSGKRLKGTTFDVEEIRDLLNK